MLDGGLAVGSELVQLGADGILDLELALAEDPDDHDPSPSWGSPGRSDTGMPAGWACSAGAGGAYGACAWACAWAACAWAAWAAWASPLAEVPSSCLGAAAVISPLSMASSRSTSLLALIMSSSLWMSSRLPPTASSSAPEAISSSIAPARACIWAVLSSARWIAMPTSPISSEMPENASFILVCASAAVLVGLMV